MSAARLDSGDLYRFSEMLRRGGELDEARILSPAMLRAARGPTPATGRTSSYRPKCRARAGWAVAPAYMGLGFSRARYRRVPP